MSSYIPQESSQTLGQHFDLNGNPAGYFEHALRWYNRYGFISFNWNHTKVRGVYTFGFTFLTCKGVITFRPSTSVTNRSTIGIRETTYVGSMIAMPASPPFYRNGYYLQDGRYFNDTTGRMNDLKSKGALAWNRLRPDLPDFSLAQEIMELKDLPSMLKDSTKRIIQAMASATTLAVAQARRDAEREMARE